MEIFFTWKVISNWIIFLEIEDFVFVKFRSKITYCFRKVSALLSKKDGSNLEGFLGKRSFFWVESMFSRLFLDIREMFFEIWKQIVKIVSLSVQLNFSRKNFIPGKMFSLIVFFRTGGGGKGGGGVFQIFVEKLNWIFGGKIVKRVVRTGINFSRATFWGKTRFSENFPVNKFFQTFSIVLVFCRFLAYLSEIRPCVQMNLLGKIFKQKNVYENFSELEQNFVVLWQKHFNRLSKMDFICPEHFFYGDFYLPGRI